MANTSNSNSSSNWVLDMSMRSQLSSWEPSLDPLPYEPVLPQKNQVPPSNPRSNPSFIDDRAENQGENGREEEHGLGPMKEMMYKIAVMQPVEIDPTMIQKPQRKNIRVSDDPQSVAARHRRERISERIRILQRMVPGGTKMDTASMLDEAIHYVKFLKKQVQELQTNRHPLSVGVGVDYSAARNWAMAIGPMSRELGFMQGAGSTTMGPRVCFIGDDGSLVPSWFE